MVPFNDKNRARLHSFSLDIKDIFSLLSDQDSIRSNVLAIKEGELEYFDPMNEDIQVNLMINKWNERKHFQQ